MSRLLVSLAFALALPLATFAAEPEKKDLITAEQVQSHPDDDKLLNSFFGQEFGAIMGLVQKDPKAAEKKVSELEAVVNKLAPTEDKAKLLLTRAKSSIKSVRSQVELAQTNIADLEKTLTEKPDDLETLRKWTSKAVQEISMLARSEPDNAEKKLAAAKEFAGKVGAAAKEDATKTQLTSLERTWTALERSIEGGKKLAALIGKDAAPLVAEAWVNGEPLTDADLKGKVVLLDFWAIWCGPCIATFPHLNEWNEKYSDKGLVMIGVTSYYDYEWDESAQRAKKAAGDITPEEEHEMLKKFAEFHSLRHRFALKSDRSLSEYYAVTGIPHVVVIDQQGKVRMVRVGSGEKNANDISGLLAELLPAVGGKAPAGGK